MQIIFSDIQYEVGIVCIEKKKKSNYGIFPMSMIWGNFKKKKSSKLNWQSEVWKKTDLSYKVSLSKLH